MPGHVWCTKNSINILSPVPLGARNLVQRSVNLSAQDSVGRLPYSKDELRRRAVWSIQRSVFFVLGVNSPSTYFPSEHFLHNRGKKHILNEYIATFADTEIRCQNSKKLDAEEVTSSPHLHNLDPFSFRRIFFCVIPPDSVYVDFGALFIRRKAE